MSSRGTPTPYTQETCESIATNEKKEESGNGSFVCDPIVSGLNIDTLLLEPISLVGNEAQSVVGGAYHTATVQ